MFSVKFRYQHLVRETKLQHDSGNPVETIHESTASTADILYCGCFIFSGGVTGISLALVELDVPLYLHQQIIDDIRGAAVTLLTNHALQPALFSMEVSISRMTHCIIPNSDIIGREERGGEEGSLADPIVVPGDEEGLDIGNGGNVNSKGDTVIDESSSTGDQGQPRGTRRIGEVDGEEQLPAAEPDM